MKTKILLVLVVLAAAGGIYLAVKGTKKNDTPETPDNPQNNIPQPAQLNVQLPAINTFPHDTVSYTEGLEFYKGQLFESGGNYKQSQLSAYDYKTGKGRKQKMPDEIFGEGITILNDKLYMLTWKEGKLFTFDPATFKQTGALAWPYGEGWGLTNDGKSLIANTGGSTIFFLDPETLKTQRSINVSDDYGPVTNVNEMEYVNGFIYANVFQTDLILKINAQTGQVVARADLSNLFPEYNHLSAAARESGQVLNGIAYNPETQTFFLTGKEWPKLFEVKIN